MNKWYVGYFYRNVYRSKYVYARSNTEAIKKAKVKNIEELYIVNEEGDRIG